MSYLASVLEDTTGSGESGKRSGGCRQHVRNVHAPRTRYNAPRTHPRSWRHGNTSPPPKRPGIIPRTRCIVRKLRKWRGRLWKTLPLSRKTPLRPLCLPVSRTPGSKVDTSAQRGRQHSSKGRLYEYSAGIRVNRWETTNVFPLENDPKTGGLQGEQFGSGGGGSDGERTT